MAVHTDLSRTRAKSSSQCEREDNYMGSKQCLVLHPALVKSLCPQDNAFLCKASLKLRSSSPVAARQLM